MKCSCGLGTEKAFRKWFVNGLSERGIWYGRVEAAAGGDAGFPDLCVMAHDSGLIKPVELKVSVARQGRLKLGLRPAQVNWISLFTQAGGEMVVLIGLHSCLDRRWAGFWLSGYPGIGSRLQPAVDDLEPFTWEGINALRSSSR